MELDEATFSSTLAEFDGIAVVEFYAPWCRTCRTVAPKFKQMVQQLSEVHSSDDVRFYTVNFKESKQLCLREHVFALPTVHFYTASLGRINRFILTPMKMKQRLTSELDRYLGESGHVEFLKSLKARETPLSPLVRYSNLVGLMQAIVYADDYLDAAETKDGAFLNNALDGDRRRLDELEALFNWIDTNGDGVIDSSELAAVAAAVGPLAASASSFADDEADKLFGTLGADQGMVGVDEFYTALLDRASKFVEEHAAEGDDAEGDDAEGGEGGEEGALRPSDVGQDLPRPSLDLGAFVTLMEAREVGEFRSPDNELKAAFESLDVNGDGVISREEVLSCMESVVRYLPTPDAEAGRDWVQEVLVAFDAIDRDGSGSLDYEEWVAVLSGAAYTYEEGGGEDASPA